MENTPTSGQSQQSDETEQRTARAKSHSTRHAPPQHHRTALHHTSRTRPATPNYSTPDATPDFIHSETRLLHAAARRRPPAIVVEIGNFRQIAAEGAPSVQQVRSARFLAAAAASEAAMPNNGPTADNLHRPSPLGGNLNSAVMADQNPAYGPCPHLLHRLKCLTHPLFLTREGSVLARRHGEARLLPCFRNGKESRRGRDPWPEDEFTT